MLRRFTHCLTFLLIAVSTKEAWAWGERGHNAIARVASRLVATQKDADIAAFGALLQRREHMLGHLANVPDIVWRSAGKEVDAFNSPSHFVDMDYILPESKVLLPKDYPKDFEAYKKALVSNCAKKQLSCAPGESEAEKVSKAGHAPYRVQQLSQELTRMFSELKKMEADPKATKEAKAALTDQALLYAGVLAHFIGDLANPHHTSQDYDGWLSDQGGLHSYFESEQVDVQGLDLEQAMFSQAQKDQPALQIFGKATKDPLTMAWDLASASHTRLETLLEIDRKYSLIKKSDQVKRSKALRKAPSEVATEYRSFLVERLAAGADALATVWIAAWEAGGKPKFDGYQSYSYPVKPDFIPLSYIRAIEPITIKAK